MADAAGKVQVLGVAVDAMDKAAVFARVADAIAAHARVTIAYANVHVLNTAATDAPLRAFLNQVDLCYCDGGGVVLGAKLLGHEMPGRMTGADWIWDLAALAEGRWRVFWLGGEPGVTAEAARRLLARYPGLVIETDHGFHPDHAPVIARINTFGPDLVLVGMGTPTQERWVAAHRDELTAPVVWALGATADFVSGKVSRGPAWLHQNQEWLARLITEPRRLWKRYLVGNTVFLGRIVRQRVLG